MYERSVESRGLILWRKKRSHSAQRARRTNKSSTPKFRTALSATSSTNSRPDAIILSTSSSLYHNGSVYHGQHSQKRAHQCSLESRKELLLSKLFGARLRAHRTNTTATHTSPNYRRMCQAHNRSFLGTTTQLSTSSITKHHHVYCLTRIYYTLKISQRNGAVLSSDMAAPNGCVGLHYRRHVWFGS